MNDVLERIGLLMEVHYPTFGSALGRRQPSDIDSALEIRAVLDRDSGGLDVALKAGARAKHEAPDGLDVAFRRAGYDHLTGLDVRIGRPARANALMEKNCLQSTQI